MTATIEITVNAGIFTKAISRTVDLAGCRHVSEMRDRIRIAYKELENAGHQALRYDKDAMAAGIRESTEEKK